MLVTIFFTIERYSSEVGLARQDAELVAFLNGAGDGPELLRELAETVAAGRVLDPAQLAALNSLLALVPVEARLEDGGRGRYVLELRPVGGTPEELASRELAGSFGSLLRRAPERLKRCEECSRFFVDTTRSRTRRYDSRACGNRARVRAFRTRHDG